MDVSQISDVDQQAIRRAMQYWVEHWDDECPTLFGVDLDELKTALHRWPLTVRDDEPMVKAVAIGALRELLYGASTLPTGAFQSALGISYDEAGALFQELYGE
jgi:hypothetical protein